jgi:bifunctional UDP-N-acetylglucosamine pyrophosphorylase/glucosamine-1-phosphate N-acetyltransferase
MKKIKNILILAGGDSSRFWPLQNKCLLDFLGKPLFVHIVLAIKDFAQNIFVVSHSLNQNLFKQEIERINLKNVFLIEQKKDKKGMAEAILACEKKIKGEVLILNGSDILNFSLILPIYLQRRQGKKTLFLAKIVDEYFPGGYLLMKEKKLINIKEKPAPKEIPSNKIKLVCDYFFDFDFLINFLKKIKEEKDDCYETSLNNILKENKGSDYIDYFNYWYTIKYPWDILPMMNFFLQNQKDKIVLGKNVKIGKYTKIEGPTFIQDNTIVGDYALIRASHIGRQCLIGGYSEVTRSYLSHQVFLHRNYVGDSILDKEVLLGAGACCANFRFDQQPIKSMINGKKISTHMKKLGAIIGEKCKIGVSSILLPGVKIGKKTFIGPGEVIEDDVEEKTFVFKEKRVKNNFFN